MMPSMPPTLMPSMLHGCRRWSPTPTSATQRPERRPGSRCYAVTPAAAATGAHRSVTSVTRLRAPSASGHPRLRTWR
eukprot:243630-Chlamydomonas_euryale.AAC.1